MPFLRAARDGYFGVGVECTLAADRGEENRTGVFQAEQMHACVDLARIDQAAGLDAHFGVVLAVGAQGGVAIDAGRQVAVVRRRQRLAGGGFEIEYVQRILGRVDDVADLLGLRAQYVVALRQ